MDEMTPSDEKFTLQPMSDAECREALANHAFGRLAINGDDGPLVFPVNYAFIESSIVIRTDVGSKLANAPLTTVAFEVDEIDPSRTWGWSVVARGPAFDISTAIDEQSEELRALPFKTWLQGEKNHVLKINVRELSGRRFGDIPPTE